MSATTTTREGAGRGAGKLILLGEHAVVYGHPALAAALELGVEARARASSGAARLRVPAWGIDVAADDPAAAPARALAALCHALGLAAGAHDVDAEATVPARAGLGSSAAFAVAVARALAAAEGRALADDDCERAAGAAEEIFHGRASGVDVALATRGGIGLYTRARGLEPLAGVKAFTVVIGLSGEARDTGARVADVARQRDAAPAETDARLTRLGELAAHGAHALARGSVRALGPLLDAAQEDLAGLGLSTPRLDAMVAAARGAGALGAKLTGAGGGGAMLALAPAGGEAAIVAALIALGASARAVSLGGAP
jgi:mevalonate kinase